MSEEPGVHAAFTPTEARGVTFEVGRAIPQLAEFDIDEDGDMARLVRELAKLNGRRSDYPWNLMYAGWKFPRARHSQSVPRRLRVR
nr:hypothetical protein [Kibdelosporangium sp. MJ126-NF4]